LLVNYLGQYGAETTVLARSPQMIMWTDDSILAQLAASTFGTRRTWTQLVLLSLVEAGLLASDDYNKAVAKLIGMGFTSTFFDANCMIEGARIAQFRASWFPLKQMAEAFQKTNAPAQGLVRQFLQFFVLLQQEPLLHPQKSLIVREFLDSLWRNPASHNMVLAMRSMSAKLFGLNVVAENEFNLTFDAWFRGLSRPII
jgi:hypothetical protein